MEMWKKRAIIELREKENNDSLRPAHYDETDDMIRLIGGNSEYLVFKDYSDAEYFAEDYVREMLEDTPESFDKTFLSGHLIVTDTDKRLIAGEEARYIADDLRESEPERLIEEAGMDIDEYNEKDSDEQEEMLDDAYNIVYDNVYDEWYDGLDSDPIYFLTKETGLYSEEDVLKCSFIMIDIEEASSDAVRIDGVSHFLSTYDGYQIDLSNGVVAYRQN